MEKATIAHRPPPRFLSLQVNKACNLRCEHCDFWKRNDDDAPNYLSRHRRAELIEEFSELNPAGKVVVAGGEPMLDLEGFFHVSRTARQHGLRCLTVVNGTRIRSAEMAARMIEEGPHEISVSLNSHREDLHDKTRGVSGAFEKAVRALRLLLEARRAKPGSDTNVIVLGLIFGANYRETEAFYDFTLNDIRVDKLKLNFIQPSFGHDEGVDPFFARENNIDPDEIVAILERCNERFKLGYNPIWLAQVGMYFRSLAAAKDLERGWGSDARTEEHICNTHDRNIMVDHYGLARLCFSKAFRGEQLERYGDLRRFWDTSLDIRAEMLKCNQFCGISHSVRRETTTVASRGKTQTVPPQRLSWLGKLISAS